MIASIFETVGIVFLSFISFYCGKFISSFKKPYWIMAMVPPFAILISVAMARWFSQFESLVVFKWILSGRIWFLLIVIAATFELSIISLKIETKRQKRLINLLMIVTAGYLTLPFLFPALLYKYHLNLKSNMESEGIFFQSNTYNCGPAAASTVLWHLGIPAKEGILAIHAKSSPIIGTQPDLLCKAIKKLYNEVGVTCIPDSNNNIKNLKSSLPYLAAIKFGLMVDHWVAVLEVKKEKIKIADPLKGVRFLSYKQFNKIWRKSGLIIRRNQQGNI